MVFNIVVHLQLMINKFLNVTLIITTPIIIFLLISFHKSPPSLPSADMADEMMFRLEASLDGSQEIPLVTTSATGSAEMIYNARTKTFDLDLVVEGIDFSNLSAAHIHLAPAGTNGPIIVGLGPVSEWTENASLHRELTGASFPGENEDELLDGDTYINVHTLQYPDGEIRGQLVVSEKPGEPTPTLSPTPTSTPTPTPTDMPSEPEEPPETEEKVIGTFIFPGRKVVCTIKYRFVRVGFFRAAIPRISCTRV